jgi:hypothetical protein
LRRAPAATARSANAISLPARLPLPLQRETVGGEGGSQTPSRPARWGRG